MSKILDMVDGRVIITPEILCISPFSEIWSKDKTKEKVNANNQIKYIWFFADFNSPYFQQPEDIRSKMIIEDVIKDKEFKVTKEIKEGVEKYKSLNTTPAIEAVENAATFLRKVQDYFKTVDLGEVNNPKSVTDIFANYPKMVESYNEAVKNAYAEQSTEVKVRGNAKTSLLEDNDI